MVSLALKKGLNGQNHSLTDFHHLMKKSLLSPKFPIPPLGWEIFPLPLKYYLENSGMFDLSITTCRNNFHTFLSLTVNHDSV